tara:strand:- start:50 stop:1495 length:1446 start_codon:yes stop_codon:yes gene_type:complete
MTMEVSQWLEQVRGLAPALTEGMGVVRKDHPSMPGAAVVFPYLRNGKPYAAKWRAVEGKDFRSTRDVSRGLYNEDCLRTGDGPVIITEGEIDCLSIIQAGFARCVSVPDGWDEKGDKRACLIAAEDALRRSSSVIVAGDADSAGRGLPKAVANILKGHDVRYVTWPDDCKDANDVLVKHGEGEICRCMTEAKLIDPTGGFITGISDMPPLPTRRVLRTGVPALDYVLAFEVGAMSVGTGTPGAGKSTITTFAAYHLAIAEDVRVGFLSFETHPYRTRDHLCRLRTGQAWDDISPAQQKMTARALDLHFRIVHRTFDDIPEGHNLGWLRDMIYTLAVRDGCKFIVVDPWNEIEHLPAPGESLTNYINFALQQIRVWAEQYDTHICLIAHPRKMMTDGKPRSPTGYDIADSAAFANKPSLGFSVHQEMADDGDEYVRLTTWKVRDSQLYGFGKGSVKLTFDEPGMSYRKHETLAQIGAGYSNP